jgi:hypothetical protein
MAANKIGRNDWCPCGSGRKVKHCCQGVKRDGGSKLMLWIVLALAAGGIVAGIASFRDTAASPAAGKVWSAEHGHYH